MKGINCYNPDRNKQFKIINSSIEYASKNNQPFISVDTKKKELVGEFKNNGKIYRKNKDPIKVFDHDFINIASGKAIPYGIYDIKYNNGFVNIGKNKDTSKFAVNSIRKWWFKIGKYTYDDCDKLYISADAGGSNGYRSRLWKYELQKFANEINIPIYVHHYPPGTSKYNKIEHKMFSFISKNWSGHPLINYKTIKNFIKNTSTISGLKIDCEIDDVIYKSGLKITTKEYESINKKKIDLKENNNNLEKWNYIIQPNN